VHISLYNMIQLFAMQQESKPKGGVCIYCDYIRVFVDSYCF